MDDRCDVAGEIGGVGMGRQVTVCSRALEALAYGCHACRTARGQFLSDGIGRLAA